MTAQIAAAGTPALWYLSRGSGAVSLILLSLSVVLGIVHQRRWYTARWPRFALHSLHRWLSLFAVSFLSVHILSVVLDSFAPIRLTDAVVPFAGSYRPLWLGLGALAFDILLAVAITSLLRNRIGQGVWRAVHWLSYAAWPLAVVHGLGTGSDVRTGWLLAIAIVCIAAVWLAIVLRVSRTPPRLRLAGFGALAAVPLALVLWLPSGPLAKGWAKRAGTPTRLLAVRNVTPTPATSAATQPGFSPPFAAYLSGTVAHRSVSPGVATVELRMRFSGGASGSADIMLEGVPLDSGGLSVEQSRVTLGPAFDPARYSGRMIALDGTRLLARVTDTAGRTLRADFRMALEGSSVRGTVSIVRG